jgi:acetyl-CoA acetyltransferase family protein
VQQIANQIIAGSIDVGIAVGAESMSTNPDGGAPTFSEKILNHPVASQNQQPMGQTSENVAGQFSIPRSAHDEFAARSYQRAEHAQKSGWFNDEIVPVKTTIKDPKTGEVKEIVVSSDDGIRYGTTAEGLSKIRSAFPQWAPSHTTGGNASQITDGAAALLLMKRSRAQELGQPIVAKFAGSTVIGLEPRIMGIGPSIAIPKILSKTGLTADDVDIFEINEAFASMVRPPFFFFSHICFATNQNRVYTVFKNSISRLPRLTLAVVPCKFFFSCFHKAKYNPYLYFNVI